jgi:hypothetical protein
MGRGKCSKIVRKTNRALERGNALGGNQHSHKSGTKWSRKDVLETRKALLRAKRGLSEDVANTAIVVEKSLKSLNKTSLRGLATPAQLR